MARAMAKAGVSITITSFTDAMAFVLGTDSQLQPYVTEAATVLHPGCNRMCPGCNHMCPGCNHMCEQARPRSCPHSRPSAASLQSASLLTFCCRCCLLWLCLLWLCLLWLTLA